MKIILKNKLLIAFILLFLFVLAFYLVREYMASKEIYTESYLRDDEYYMIKKVYGVNEYSMSQLTDKDITNRYLNDYINNNIEAAYDSLNAEYRDKKFGSIEAYKNYINSIKYSGNLISIDRKKTKNGKDIYGAYDSYNNHYNYKNY